MGETTLLCSVSEVWLSGLWCSLLSRRLLWKTLDEQLLKQPKSFPSQRFLQVDVCNCIVGKPVCLLISLLLLEEGDRFLSPVLVLDTKTDSFSFRLCFIHLNIISQNHPTCVMLITEKALWPNEVYNTHSYFIKLLLLSNFTRQFWCYNKGTQSKLSGFVIGWLFWSGTAKASNVKQRLVVHFDVDHLSFIWSVWGLVDC